MHISAQAFWLPKAGNAPEEYEDAYWPNRTIHEKKVNGFRCAVADGATETSFSGLWARMLVQEYCRRRLDPGKRCKTLPHLQRAWLNQVSARQLPWYAEEKLRSGAFSSLLGLTLRRPASIHNARPTWQALAIGDSCLFQVRGDDVVAAYPLEHSKQFNSHPVLLSTNPASNEAPNASIDCRSGTWEVDDAFYLMTDALACWFLKAKEDGERPWAILRHLETPDQVESFETLIVKLRHRRLIRNDDVTLIRVCVTG